MDKTLAQYLKTLRNSYNYSQEYLASHLNITRQTYSHYETGRIIPPANSLYNLSKLYGIPIEKFMELAVTYNINMDFAINPRQVSVFLPDDSTEFLEFINLPENRKKFKQLERREKLYLCYFLQLDDRDQKDILEFMKIKIKNRSKENDPKNVI